MKKKRINYSMILCLCLLSFTCGVNLYSTNEEVKMGKSFAAEIAKQLKFLKDPQWVSYVNDIGQKIVRVSDRQDIEYHFHVVDDTSQVNAFALPGGYIYIYTGLLLRAENEAEIAGVLGHEVGHVVGKHGMKRLSAIVGYQLILAIALGGNPGQLEKLAADVIAGTGMLKYGRDNEFESDDYGVRYTYAAGYDPEGIVTFFQKLDSLRVKEPTAFEKFMSTHPNPDDRVERAQDKIALLAPKAGLIKNTEKYEEMKARLMKK